MGLSQQILRIRKRLWTDRETGEAFRDADAALVTAQRRIDALEWRGGHALVDFGSFPGAAMADVMIDNQPGIDTGSLVRCWIAPAQTADHSPDEHAIEQIDCRVRQVRAGRGFTLTAFCTGAGLLYGQWRLGWMYAGAS